MARILLLQLDQPHLMSSARQPFFFTSITAPFGNKRKYRTYAAALYCSAVVAAIAIPLHYLVGKNMGPLNVRKTRLTQREDKGHL